MPKNGTRVLMRRTHPHAGQAGFIYEQPGENNGPSGMYLIVGDSLGNWYAERHDFTLIDGGD